MERRSRLRLADLGNDCFAVVPADEERRNVRVADGPHAHQFVGRLVVVDDHSDGAGGVGVLDLVLEEAVSPPHQGDSAGQGTDREGFARQRMPEVARHCQGRRQGTVHCRPGAVQGGIGCGTHPDTLHDLPGIPGCGNGNHVGRDRRSRNRVERGTAQRSARRRVSGSRDDHAAEVHDRALSGDRQGIAGHPGIRLSAFLPLCVPRSRGGRAEAEVQDVHAVRNGVVDRGDDRVRCRMCVDPRRARDLVDAEVRPGSDTLLRAGGRIRAHARRDHRHGRAVTRRIVGRCVIRRRGVRLARIQKVEVGSQGNDLVVGELQVLGPAFRIPGQRGHRVVPERRVVQIEARVDDGDLDSGSRRVRAPKAGAGGGQADHLRDRIELELKSAAPHHGSDPRERGDRLRLGRTRPDEDRIEDVLDGTERLSAEIFQRGDQGLLLPGDRPRHRRHARECDRGRRGTGRPAARQRQPLPHGRRVEDDGVRADLGAPGRRSAAQSHDDCSEDEHA